MTLKQQNKKLRTALKRSSHIIETLADLGNCYCSLEGVCLYHRVIQENMNILEETKNDKS